jgi:hypothetical protein
MTPQNVKIKLMEIPFSNLNGNLFGTKSMSLLFTVEEMRNGYVEPSAKQIELEEMVPLDNERINVIKRLVVKF